MLEREVLVGAEVVDPELLCPRRLAGRLALEEEHVCLDALSAEDAGREPQEGVDVVLLQPPPHGLSCTAFKEHVGRDDDRRRATYLEQALDVLEEVELLVRGGGLETVALVGLAVAYGPAVGSYSDGQNIDPDETLEVVSLFQHCRYCIPVQSL